MAEELTPDWVESAPAMGEYFALLDQVFGLNDDDDDETMCPD